MNMELKTLATELVAAVLERFVPTAETIVALPDAAKALNVKPSTLRKMCYQGRIGYISDGKNLKFKVADLNRYINEHYHPEGETA
jgi:excisionase family DNA binding protein